jgi:hypothetical protein
MTTNDAERLLVYAINEQRASENEWHELCTGAKAPAEVAALRAGIESEEELADKLERFAPMTEEVRRQTLASLLARYYPSSAAVTGEVKEEATAAATRQEPAVRERSGLRLATVIVSGAMALAAAIVLAWFLQRSDADRGVETMPEFRLELRDGNPGDVRGATGGEQSDARCGARYRADQNLSMLLRAVQPVHEPLEVAMLARHEDDEDARWLEMSRPSQGENGNVTIEQPLTELGLTRGQWMLTVYMTRVGQPHDLEALAELEPGAHPSAMVLEGTVCVEE